MSDTSNTTDATNATPYYLSYLLRLWYAPGNAAYSWRASLEEPLTQQVHRFEDLQGLFNFLLAPTEHGTGIQGATSGLRTED